MHKKIIKLAIAFIILLILFLFARRIVLKICYPQKYSEYVEKYSIEYGIDKELVYSIIKAESNYKKDVISNKNAIGLMQLKDTTAFDVAKSLNIEITNEDLKDPEININLGSKYVASLIEKYDSVELALAAYNAGIGNIDKWIEDGILKSDGSDIEKIPYKETNNYIRKVLRSYKIYKEIYR